MPRNLLTDQLLQGLQKRDPRMYDLIQSIVSDVEGVQNIVDPIRTLSKTTTGGARPEPDEFADIYEVTKRISLRV